MGPQDIESASVPRADRVLIPLIVLTNHAEFDPLGEGTPFSLDVDAIQAAAAAIVLPGQVRAPQRQAATLIHVLRHI